MAAGHRLQRVAFGVFVMCERGGRRKSVICGYLQGREGGIGGGRRLSAEDVERL